MPFTSVEEALEDLKQGRFVIVVDDQDRENEGDLTMAAQFITPEAVNFMARFGRGLICAPLHPSYFSKLAIPLMVADEGNTSKYGTNFGVSVGAKTGVTTGISAGDRARTIQVLVDPQSKPEDLSRPGHIFPLKARENGVLERKGHTEAALDLTRLAGLEPVGVICEILNDDGSMARLPQLEEFAKKHRVNIVSIEALVSFRRQRETIVERVDTSVVPTSQGTFQAVAYRDHMGLEHLAMCLGEPRTDGVLTRLHSSCLTGDVFGSLRCDCGEQLRLAMSRIMAENCGLVLYLAQEGRGIGLANKIRAYALQDRGLDTVEANRSLGFPDDARTYDVGAAILKDLGVRSVRLLTNNPNKVAELKACGIEVRERLALKVPAQSENDAYLRTKAEKMGHLLNWPKVHD